MRVQWLLLATGILAGCELVIHPGDVTPPGEAADGGCQAQTCASLGKTCGSTDDGCGTELSCGSCPAGQTCSSHNTCSTSCTGETDAQLCQKANAACGPLSATDRCGAHRTAQCGGCAAGLLCGAASPNVCGCTATSCPSPSRCASLGGTCETGCTGPADCSGGAQCVGGVCSCASPTHLCGAACVANDPSACGDACQLCPTDPNGTATCDGHSCSLTCSQGYLDCSGACVPCPTHATATSCQGGTTCGATACEAGYSPCGGQCCTWHATETVTTSKAVGTPAIAVDPAGDVYIAYELDSGTTQEAHYAKRTSSGTWSHETIESLNPVSTRQGVAIAVDASGDAYVAYLDADWKLRLGERKKFVTGWTRSTISASGATTRAPSIALDPSGGLHLAWCDSSNDDYVLNHSVRPTSSLDFTTEPADPQSGAGYWTAMAIDSAGILQVAELVSTGSSNDEISLATKGVSGWTVSKVAAVSAGAANEVKVALDAQKVPHLAWSDADLQAVRHASPQGSGWQVENVGAGTVLDSAAIAFLASQPQLAYVDSGSAVQHAFQGAGGWQSEQVNSNGTEIALVADGLGGLRMCFRDATSGAVRYAYYGPDP